MPVPGRRNFMAYQAANQRSLTQSTRSRVMIFASITVLYTAFLYRRGGAGSFMGTSESEIVATAASAQSSGASASGRQLAISTWNIAAINNNPFEYWITIDDNPGYEKLMVDVEKFLEDPGDYDVPVEQVFTNEMFASLDAKMTGVGWESVKSYWEDDFKNRKIISEFMKDGLLGSKRLASMPDRVTNTINVAGSSEPVCRPTVINMYEGDLGTMDGWYAAWEEFMFDAALPVSQKDGTVAELVPYQMLLPIKKSKYPDITEEEEAVSIPLQTMCGAIFDAILVHMMNTVSKPDEWQPLKRTMVESLNKKKVPNTLRILETTYGKNDILCLQEVSGALVQEAKSRELGNLYHIVAPQDMDSVRDQNSVILLSKTTFPNGPTAEVTSVVEAAFPEGVDVPVSKGDILAITATDAKNVKYVIASFHGDTNGLATIPVLDAIIKAVNSDPNLAGHRLIFGLDANTYEKGKPGKTQDVMEFGRHYQQYELSSCWGDMPDAGNYTTYNARTYLQPQLNKACKQMDKREKGDVNPKDFILFGKKDFEIVHTWKDNTGEKKYIEDMAFPTLKFPSDHGILSTIINPKA
mmetsp:Transcript_27488/g.33331  ORF Transcript_27488/g.33331 Transcript_27488/m.33331 type:complete len:581 (+) Transcript_27488:287-2029(+)